MCEQSYWICGALYEAQLNSLGYSIQKGKSRICRRMFLLKDPESIALSYTTARATVSTVQEADCKASHGEMYFHLTVRCLNND